MIFKDMEKIILIRPVLDLQPFFDAYCKCKLYLKYMKITDIFHRHRECLVVQLLFQPAPLDHLLPDENVQ